MPSPRVTRPIRRRIPAIRWSHNPRGDLRIRWV
jgi:hypothetical protein